MLYLTAQSNKQNRCLDLFVTDGKCVVHFREGFSVAGLSPGKANLSLKSSSSNSPSKRGQRKDEGWKEVTRK